jgi:hypothetical protein
MKEFTREYFPTPLCNCEICMGRVRHCDINNAPSFNKRTPRKKYLVRFWAEKELYDSFRKEVRAHDFLISDVFKQFMDWFINSKNKEIK